jgi:TPR repeat protein
MIRRSVLTSALALGLSFPVIADVQYGINVEPDELLFMMGHHNMATNLELGRQTAVDYAAAAEFYRKAAVLGYPLAQNRLGRLYEMGRGVAQNNVTAYVWYAIAASHGNDHAMANRDALSKRMIQSEILDAQSLTRQLQQQLP